MEEGHTRTRVQCLFKLLLFQMLVVTLCAAKHVSYDDSELLVHPRRRLEDDVQNSIRNIVHTGIYSHLHLDTSQAEVVTPVKVTREGALLSRIVEHEHEHGHVRARRDLSARDHTLQHAVHYNLTIGGRELRLDLRPSVSFMTPSLIVERHTATGRTRDRPHPGATGCHYRGSVRGQSSSTVALSACDGLAGLLRTEHGEYWIEPSNQIPTDSTEGRPHVIFKRSAVSKSEALHRSKRAVDSRTNNNNQNRRDRYSKQQREQYLTRNTDSKSNRAILDKRRREYLEARRKKLELMRNNPYEYRRLLDEQRRKQLSRRNQIKHSNQESRRLNITNHSQNVRYVNSTYQITNRNKVRINKSRGYNDEREGSVKPRKRRRRRVKNCGTKQPRYQWKSKNEKREAELLKEKHEKQRDHKNHHRNTHQQQGSRRLNSDGSRRSARSISEKRHVEVLLVADSTMTQFHDKGNVETYLLTIMNLVSTLYMDPSIGNYIKVVVVKITLVEHLNDRSRAYLNVSSNADATLASFCRWQREENKGDDSDPHHHDVAILVTRQDICSQNDTPCSTLGVAHVAGICKPDRSCSVNEDNGITLAHTITHELGHNFGLYHDTEKIGCHRRVGATLYIMTPVFEADTGQVAWSRCSKRDVTNFLDSGLGECLSDEPSKRILEYPKQPAGEIFDAATQCHLQFGAEAAVCAEPAELCEHLWCFVNNTCKTMLRPAAPGTTCGPNMWCQDQKCVPRVPPAPQDGGWGAWSAWSECSRTCGGGVSTQSRECNSPEPKNNGDYCTGQRSRYKVCNNETCPAVPNKMPTFRELQCSAYDELLTKWVPYFDQDKPCELICVPKDRPDVEINGGFVKDGTPCRQSPGARDMCIAGVCHRVGCDWVVGSEAEEDACGVCGGDGLQCKTVQGIYNKGTTTQSGFSEVAVIPAGSRNVKIQEKVNHGNFIAIGSARNNNVYIKGTDDTTLTETLVAGSLAIYERDRDWEKVQIPGPIKEDIKVYQRIFSGRRRNPGVTYQYTVDRTHPMETLRRRWTVGEWTRCSRSCGLGTITRHLVCKDEYGREVEESQCYHMEAPNEALMQRCQVADCARTLHARHTPHTAAAYTTRQATHEAHQTQSTAHDAHEARQPSHEAHQPSSEAHQTRQSLSEAHQTRQSLHEVHETHSPVHKAHEALQPSHEAYQTRQPSSEAHQTRQSLHEVHETHSPVHEAHEARQPSHEAHQTRQPSREAYERHMSTQTRHEAQSPSHAVHETHPRSHAAYERHHSAHDSRQSSHAEHDSRQSSHAAHDSRQSSHAAHDSRQSSHAAHDSRQSSHAAHDSRQSSHAAHDSRQSSHASHATYSLDHVTYTTHSPSHMTLQPPSAKAAVTTYWWFGLWSTCSPACRMPGRHSSKQRNVYCVDKTSNKVIDDSTCDQNVKPTNRIVCRDIPPC